MPRAVTIPGPESHSLAPSAKGVILMDQSFGGILAIQLPSLGALTVRPSDQGDDNDRPNIHMLSGPDTSRRIVYVEDHFFTNPQNRRHLLKTVRLDGTGDTTLFTRPGDAMWAETAAGHGEIGEKLSLAPVGGRVAFLSHLKNLQMPSALVSQGLIEIWNIDQQTGGPTDIQAVDEGLGWLPDGKHLIYVKIVGSKNPAVSNSNDPITHSFLNWGWNSIPAIFVRDVETQKEFCLHSGWRPIVSADGTNILICDRDLRYYCVQTTTGKVSQLTGPGNGWPIAMLDSKTILALCAPTAGAPVRFSPFYSPLSSPKEFLALKLASIDSNSFQTVISYVDPRSCLSFGPGLQSP